MRNRFDRELEVLNNELISMGALIENAIGDAVKALIEKDAGLAYKAIDFDSEVDEKEKDIDYGGQWLYWWFPGEGGA